MKYCIQKYSKKKERSNGHDIEFVAKYNGKSYNYGWHGAEHWFTKYLEKLNNLEWENSTVGTSEGNVINTEIRSSKKLPFKISIASSYHKDIYNINNIIKSKLFNKNPSFLKDILYFDNNLDLLKYEEGDFFAKHTDGDSEFNHFGTLLILPPKAYSEYEGGELVLYDGEEEIEIISEQDHWKIIGFDTEIPHELKPITSGTRYAFKTKIIIPDDTTEISIYNKNSIEYTDDNVTKDDDYYSDDSSDDEEKKEEKKEDGNYILTNTNYEGTNKECIRQINKSINFWEKKIEEYKERLELFKDNNYHQFEDKITSYMQTQNYGKFIIICEHYNSYTEPNNLYGNDRKIFDKLVQNYNTDIIILKAKVDYGKSNYIRDININDKYNKMFGGYSWDKDIEKFNINYDLYKERYKIGGYSNGEHEEYNDENYFTVYTNKVILMLVTFRI